MTAAMTREPLPTPCQCGNDGAENDGVQVWCAACGVWIRNVPQDACYGCGDPANWKPGVCLECAGQS